MNRIMVAALGLALVFVVGGVSPARGDGEKRSNCSPLPLTPAALPVEALAFEAIGPAHFSGLRPALSEVKAGAFKPVEAGGAFNETAKGVTLLAITGRRDAAKLLVTVDGADLLVRRVVVYDASGAVARDDRDLRLRPGEGLALRGARAGAGHDLQRTASTTALRAMNGTKVAVLPPMITVRTTVRYMHSREHGNDAQRELPPDRIKALLAPAGPANVVWRQAAIFFWLTMLERCEYALTDFPDAPESGAMESIPWPIEDCQRLFRQVNRAYNGPARTGLDLYVWFELGAPLAVQQIVAYAAAHRDDGPSPGPGAVWLDIGCPSPACGRILGHEIGHFLGLRHACDLPEEVRLRRHCDLPVGDVPVCPRMSRTNTNLMRGDFVARGVAAKTLIPEQIRTARSIARERAAH